MASFKHAWIVSNSFLLKIEVSAVRVRLSPSPGRGVGFRTMW